MSRRKLHQDPHACLNQLLDRHEANPEGKTRINEFVSQSFASYEAEHRFRELVTAAGKTGAVRLHMDKGDAAHLMKKVELLDPEPLYLFLSRKPRTSLVDEALSRLSCSLPENLADRALSCEFIDLFAQAWRRGKPLHRIHAQDTETAVEFIRAFVAITARAADDLRDLRSFSRQTCGDSKLIERHKGRLIAEARRRGQVPPGASAEEAEGILSLEKFSHLVQVAGDLPIIKAITSRNIHVGLHPDMLAEMTPTSFRTFLTIENYASFNRYVREVMQPSEVVLYTGGWPGRSEKLFISYLARCADRSLHWGDVDMAGAGIADAVWRIAGREIALHQMSPEIARAFGTPHGPSEPLQTDKSSPAYSLIQWLAGPEAHILEQEELDPRPVASSANLAPKNAPDRVHTGSFR